MWLVWVMIVLRGVLFEPLWDTFGILFLCIFHSSYVLFFHVFGVKGCCLES